MRWAIAILFIAQFASGAAFTTITNGTDLQDVDLFNEIATAVYERGEAVQGGVGLDYSISVGDTFTQEDLFSGFSAMQGELEALVFFGIEWVDHTQALTTGTDIATLDLASWRQIAGINSNGFKRSTDGGVTFSYGQLQQGDTIGKWLWEELQAGCSALKWTCDKNVGSSDKEVRTAGGAWDSNCTTARNDHLSRWATSPWSSSASFVYRATARAIFSSFSGNYRFSASRYRGTLIGGPVFGTDLSTNLSHSAELYLLATAASGFYDMDGLGLSFNQMSLYETQASASTNARSTYINPSTNSPVSLPRYSSSCSFDEEIRVAEADAIWVYKWDFTNSN